MSVAPSPIITTFLKWNCSFRWVITFPLPPDSAVGCVSSNPAYSPRKQCKDRLETQIFSWKWRKISACGLDFTACSPAKLPAPASQINNSKVSLRLGFHPSLQWGDFQRKIETFSEKNRNLCGQCYQCIPRHSGVDFPTAALRMMQRQCRKAWVRNNLSPHSSAGPLQIKTQSSSAPEPQSTEREVCESSSGHELFNLKEQEKMKLCSQQLWQVLPLAQLTIKK